MGSSNSPGNNRGPIQPAGFGNPQSAAEVRQARTTPEMLATTAVQILFKPNPAYTEEARHLQLEGEVLLEVAFSGSGQCRVIRVVRGLGHGLDESAIRAAQQIRFRPATGNGQPVDSIATIHVVFRLAY